MKSQFVDAETALARWKNAARHCRSNCNLGMALDLVSEIARQAKPLELVAVKSQSYLLVAFWMVLPG